MVVMCGHSKLLAGDYGKCAYDSGQVLKLETRHEPGT
jgi:hypothetical protein